jgi:hypothetical protein
MTQQEPAPSRLFELLGEVKRLAQEYYQLTGRPLGVTGEVAEYEAARLLDDVELAPPRQSGYDASRVAADRTEGRSFSTADNRTQRTGSIRLDREWDSVLLVLLDECYETSAIWVADRPVLTDALTAPGSRARNERGQLSVSKFKRIGRPVW